MKCNVCGFENGEKNNFCEECGNSLSNPQKEVVTEEKTLAKNKFEEPCQIEISVLETGDLVIQLISSKNEVRLNGESLDSINMYELLDGDLIKTSDSLIKIRILQEG